MVKVSVIIPARNEERCIASCLDSLLKQTKRPFEIIVVTDNSDDRTEEIVNEYKRRGVRQLVFNGKSSPAIARNRGTKIARGDVFCFIDADVICSPTFIEETYKVFSDPEIMWAGGVPSTCVKTFIQGCYKAKLDYIQKRRVKDGSLEAIMNTVRRELFNKLGGYPEDAVYFEDRMLWEKIKDFKGYRIKSLVYHNDPGTLDEVIRQARYLGKGLSVYGVGNLLRDNPSLRIAVYSFSIIFAFAALILLLSPNRTVILGYAALIMAVALISYGLIRAMVYSMYSKMPLESFTWVFVLAPIRLFFVGSEYLENKLKSQQ